MEDDGCQDKSLLDFGELLGCLLKERQRTQTWLANRLEVDRPRVHKWIHSKLPPPRVAVVEAISLALSLDAADSHLLFKAAGYSYEVSSAPLPPPLPSYTDTFLLSVKAALRELLAVDEIPKDNRRYLSVWVLHLLDLIVRCITPRRTLLLIVAFCLGWLTSALMAELYRWPLPDGASRLGIFLRWAVGGTVVPLLIAVLTTPDGDVADTPPRTLLLLKSAGASTGFFVMTIMSVGGVLVAYHLGIAPLWKGIVVAVLGIALFFSWAVARRIPAERRQMFEDRIDIHPADRRFLVVGLLIHPVVAIFLYLVYDLLALRPIGLGLLLLAVAVIALLEHRKRVALSPHLTIALLGLGVPAAIILLTLIAYPLDGATLNDWLGVALLFVWMALPLSLVVTHAVRGISRFSPRAFIIAEVLLLGLALLFIQSPLVGSGAALTLLLLWRWRGQQRFGKEWHIHLSAWAMLALMLLSASALYREWLPLPLNLLAFTLVALVPLAWASRARPLFLPPPAQTPPST